MDCPLSDVELVAYHLGASEDAARDRVEEHLVSCGSCLRAYLALKRRMEQRDTEQRPSPAARQRLRDEVLRTFRPTVFARARRIFARPIPLYQGIAVAAVAVLAVAFAPALAKRASTSFPHDEQRVDSSLQSPVVHSIY